MSLMRKINSPSEKYKVILTVIVVFLAGYVYLEWPPIVLYTIIIFGTISVISSKASSFLVKIWILLGKTLGLFIPKIILGFIFFFFITPWKYLRLLVDKSAYDFSKNQMKTSLQDLDDSYDKAFFEKMW